ncbi:MAG: hypothetical protein QXS27_05415 [Candidatus Jordarchaeaceae archaeon]
MSHKKFTVDLPGHVAERFEQISQKNGFSVPKLLNLILMKFVEWDGNVYSGEWKEGSTEMGRKVVIDWPHYPSTIMKPDRIIRVKNEELK